MAKSARARDWRSCLGSCPALSTVIAQFSTQREYAVDRDFDAVSLEYAWGLAPDSKRCAQCTMTDSYEACIETFMRWCSLEVAWIRSHSLGSDGCPVIFPPRAQIIWNL